MDASSRTELKKTTNITEASLMPCRYRTPGSLEQGRLIFFLFFLSSLFSFFFLYSPSSSSSLCQNLLGGALWGLQWITWGRGAGAPSALMLAPPDHRVYKLIDILLHLFCYPPNFYNYAEFRFVSVHFLAY